MITRDSLVSVVLALSDHPQKQANSFPRSLFCFSPNRRLSQITHKNSAWKTTRTSIFHCLSLSLCRCVTVTHNYHVSEPWLKYSIYIVILHVTLPHLNVFHYSQNPVNPLFFGEVKLIPSFSISSLSLYIYKLPSHTFSQTETQTHVYPNRKAGKQLVDQ